MLQPVFDAALDHPAYHEALKLPKYNRRVTVVSACSAGDSAKVLRRLKPDWTRDDHAALAAAHATTADSLETRYSELLDKAAQETFGRPFEFGDYRISAIGRDEFSPEMKDSLRFVAHAKGNHRLVSQAHAHAARWYR